MADTGNDKINVPDFLGAFVREFGTSGTGNGQFRGPRDVGAGIDSRVYVADTGNDRIQVFDFTGGFVTSFGSAGTGSRRFESPQGVWIAKNNPPSGSVFVFDPPITEGISGRVTDQAAPTAGHEYAVVTVSDATTFDLVAVVQADGDHQAAVPPGTYSVAFMDPTGAYDPEYYQDAQFPAFDPVTVTAGAVTDVDLVVSQPLSPPRATRGTSSAR